MIDFCLLGTGGTMPLPNRFLATMLIRFDGRLVLVDCGECTQVAMKKISWGFKNLDAICITHFHADHIAGLPGLLLTLANAERRESLTISGPVGLEFVVKSLMVICPVLPFKINFIELQDDENSFQIFDLEVKSCKANHTVPCQSYSFSLPRRAVFLPENAQKLGIPVKLWSKLQKGSTVSFDGKSISPLQVMGKDRKGLKLSYVTDTRPSKEISNLVKGSDVLICEGTHAEEDKISQVKKYRHMLFREAAELARDSDCKELVLTHFGSALNKPQDFIENASSVFPATTIPKDGFTKTLLFED